MKGHLMAAMTLLAWTVAAVAADGGVAAYEQGKVYGPIVELGDEARTIDGNGAIIDGGGTNRCATLGPNVTLRNFTFRNGKAAVGGGVWGGAAVNCRIEDCIAREYGAAVANCKVSRTAISGCKRPLDGSVKAAMHGGIAADSTLDGVTIAGCRVELGSSVPGFGGIAANSALADCTVTNNTLVISGDHYGLLFYGGSLERSTIRGNDVDSSLENVAAYMKVTPSGCTLDGDSPLPPGPVPPGPAPTPPDPPGPFDPWIAFENIYFRATLADLGATAVPTNRKITIKAEGLPKGLKLVTTALRDARNGATGSYAYSVEGVPTELMDGVSRIAYVRVTDNKVQTLYALDLVVRPAADYERRSFPDGTNMTVYANYSVQWLWDVAKNPKNWTFSGLPGGIKYAAKDTGDAKAQEVYGTPTKAGRFTVKAVEKIAGTSYKSTHVATFTVWPDGKAGEEWTDQAYVGVYRGSDKSVKSASGLPTGIKFTARDIMSGGDVVTEAHHFYGTPTKAGTYAVTLTHEDKSKTQFLWTITPADAPSFELELTETAVDPAAAKAAIRLGVAYDWTIDATAGATVTAKGLPTGLKLVKTAVRSGTRITGYDYSVSGVPTKAGEFFVTFTTKLNGVSTVTTAAFTVLDLPAWAKGTFDGGADETLAAGGQVTFTVSKAGKLSGKWLSEGTSWTLTAASYDRYDAETASYVAPVVGKTGSGKNARVFTNELAVAGDAAGGVATNGLFLAYQNNWKTEPWKTIGKGIARAAAFEFRPYADAGDDHTNDFISLKFSASGKVTVKASYFKSISNTGKISWTTASGAAVLCPQDLPGEGDAFPAVVFVYLPPKKGTPTEKAAYAVCVRLWWNGTKFVEWTEPE